MAWRRLSDPVVPDAGPAVPAPIVDPVVLPSRRKRRTRAEIANDRVVAEQAAVAEGARHAERLRAEARERWEAGRPCGPVGVDRGRFVF